MNIVLLARDLFEGGVDPVMASLVVVTTLLYAAAALALAARVFGAESVLYSEQSGWSDLFRRPTSPARRRVSQPRCGAWRWQCRFTSRCMASSCRPARSAWPCRRALVAILSVVLFAGLPALAANLGRVRWDTGFGLRAPRPAALAAGLLLGLSLWPLLLQLLFQFSALEDRHQQLLEMVQQSRQSTPAA